MNDQLCRLASFLSEYCQTIEGCPILPPDPAYLKCAVEALIKENIFTPDDLKKKAIADYSVIIPYDWFPKTA